MSKYLIFEFLELSLNLLNFSVRGYRPPDHETPLHTLDNVENHMLQELIQRKDELMFELQNYEQNNKKIRERRIDTDLIDPSTKVTCKIHPNTDERCIDLVFTVDSGAVIKAAIVSAEQLFENGSNMTNARNPSDKLSISLRPDKDVSVEMNAQVLIGHPMSYVYAKNEFGVSALQDHNHLTFHSNRTKFHVYELKYNLPKFSMYIPVKELKEDIISFVRFNTSERINRVNMIVR